MHAARDNRDEADEGLPDPRLNPLINPRLGKNLGRWADVYYTTPPEKRDAAVLELVRELETVPEPVQEAEPSGQSHWPNPLLPTVDVASTQAALSEGPVIGHRFCVLCGSPVQKEPPSACLEAQPATSIHDPGQRVDPPSISFGPLLNERELAHVSGKRSPWKHIFLVLLACALLAGWSLRYLRLDSVLQAANLLPMPPVIIDNRPPSAIAAPVLNVANPPTRQKITVPSPPLRKPSAGKPVECSAATLNTCPGADLYRKTMALANAIDARFLNYDKRMALLVRNSKGNAGNSERQKQARLRQANLAAQRWERSQLASYAMHEKADALKYRAELMRRTTVTAADKKLAKAYVGPVSCLQLHYIAEDLRRLAARLPRTKYANRVSEHLAANISRP